MKNRNGNLLIGVVILALLASGDVVLMLGTAKRAFKARAEEGRSLRNTALNHFDLALVADRFRLPAGNALPAWYPDPYPTPQQIAAARPVIGVIQAAPPGTLSQVPLVGKRTVAGALQDAPYLMDASGFASLTNPANIARDGAGNPTEPQAGWYATGDITKLSSDEIGAYLSAPNQPWPSTSGTLQKTATTKVSFIQYYAGNSPSQVGEVLVELEGNPDATTATGRARTLARVRVDAPADPSCRIELSPGQTLPLTVGATARFRVLADNLVASASASPGGPSYQSIPLAQQSIRNRGVQTVVSQDIPFTVPATPSPGSNGAGQVIWRVNAQVSNLAQTAYPDCTPAEVTVGAPPVPSCALSASPTQITHGGTTTLNLTCQNVSQMWIQGTPCAAGGSACVLTGPQSARMTYTKSGYQSDTVRGSGQGYGPPVNVTAIVGESACRYNDPNLIELTGYNFGRVATNAWDEREISNGPERSYLYAVDGLDVGRNHRRGNNLYKYGRTNVETIVTGYTSYGRGGLRPTYTTGQVFGYTPAYSRLCRAGYICMYGMSCPLGDCRYPTGLVYKEVGPANSNTCTLSDVWVRYPQGGCFAEGTLIALEDGSQIPVEKVRRGDRLRNPLTGKSASVHHVISGPEKPALWRVRASGRELRVTAGHAFLTQRGIVRADGLRPGDALIAQGEAQKIELAQSERKSRNELVWNIQLEGTEDSDHVLSANGIASGDLHLQNKVKR